jgi:hypothetical protein
MIGKRKEIGLSGDNFSWELDLSWPVTLEVELELLRG